MKKSRFTDSQIMGARDLAESVSVATAISLKLNELL
jgi:hypothetical protein